MPQVPIRSLLKVLTITLIMHVCSTGMRFTATLDAINSGASTFWVGAMLASISLGPMCFAIPSGRWLDRGGPRGPLAGARIGMMLAGSSVLLFPAAQYGIASLFAAATLTGFSFMLTNVVVQRLTGDVSTPKTRQLAFTALSLTTATSNLASPVAAGYLIEHFSYAAVYMWALGLPLLLSIVLLFPGMRRLLNTASRRRKKLPGADGQPNKERSGSAMDFLKDPPMRAVLCASVMISIAWEVGNLLIPVYADSVGLSPSEIGWVLGSFACATFVVRFCTPILLRYVLEWAHDRPVAFLSDARLCSHAVHAQPVCLDGRCFSRRSRAWSVIAQHDVARLPLRTAASNRRSYWPAHHSAQCRQIHFSAFCGLSRHADRRRRFHLGTGCLHCGRFRLCRLRSKRGFKAHARIAYRRRIREKVRGGRPA